MPFFFTPGGGGGLICAAAFAVANSIAKREKPNERPDLYVSGLFYSLFDIFLVTPTFLPVFTTHIHDLMCMLYMCVSDQISV